MSTSVHYIAPAQQLLPARLPLYACAVPAGFPSPADDQLDPPLDLAQHLFRNPASTFLARVTGNSMTRAGIHSGDLIAVDRALPAQDGSIVVAVVEGEHTVKRLRQRQGRIWLEAENDQYLPLEVLPDARLTVWGVVTHVIHALEGRPAAVPLQEWKRRHQP